MTNENDRILERMRGMPAKQMSKLEAMMDPTYPQLQTLHPENNDNDEKDARIAALEAKLREIAEHDDNDVADAAAMRLIARNALAEQQ